MGTGLPPAGWHQDPEDATQLRWWDGQRWTEHRHARATETVAPQAGVPTEAGGVPAVLSGASLGPRPTVPELASYDGPPIDVTLGVGGSYTRPRVEQDPLADVDARIARQPRDHRLRMERGEILASRGRWTDAAIAFAEAQAIEPQSSEIRKRQLAMAKQARTTGDPRVPTRWAAFVRGYKAWTEVPTTSRPWLLAPAGAIVGRQVIKAWAGGEHALAIGSLCLLIGAGVFAVIQHRARERQVAAFHSSGRTR